MTSGRLIGGFALVVISWCLCSPMAAQSGDPVVIQSKLSALFKLTTTTADLTDIVTAGDIVQVRRPGLVMFAVGSQLGPTNTYKAGRISQGFGTLMVMSNKQTVQRRFVPGEKFWVTRVMVQNDSISFDLFSDPYFDVRYYANLKVMFPDKKTVPPVDTAIQLVAEVLTPGNGGGQGAQPAPAPVAPPAPVDAIAPPPPPTDAPPPTIALDQTPEQVVAGFGQPMRVAKLGAKEIYYYKDMKVTFTSGKVTNVE